MMSGAESDGRESAGGGAATGPGFSEAQLGAIAGVVQQLLDRALTERGGSAPATGSRAPGTSGSGPSGADGATPGKFSSTQPPRCYSCMGEGEIAPGYFGIAGRKGAWLDCRRGQ